MLNEIIFFDTWMSLFRTFIIGILAYVTMVLLLRISGKRTLSKMNAFDFIITIALGSILASVITNKNIALADGVLSFGLLISLQYIITWLSFRNKAFTNLIKSDPALLYYKGSYLYSAMKKERVPKEEIMAAMREKGKGNLQDIAAVIIETDGSLSVVNNSAEEMIVLKKVKKHTGD